MGNSAHVPYIIFFGEHNMSRFPSWFEQQREESAGKELFFKIYTYKMCIYVGKFFYDVMNVHIFLYHKMQKKVLLQALSIAITIIIITIITRWSSKVIIIISSIWINIMILFRTQMLNTDNKMQRVWNGHRVQIDCSAEGMQLMMMTCWKWWWEWFVQIWCKLQNEQSLSTVKKKTK